MLDRLFLGAAAAALVAFPALAQEGEAILQQTAQTVKELKGLSFNAKLTNSPGSMTAAIKTDIDVTMVRAEDEKGTWNVRYSGTATGLGTAGDEEGALRIEVHDDGTATTWIDFAEKKVNIRRSRIAKGPEIQMATYGTQVLDDIRPEAPFANALGGADVTLEGEESVDGTACDIIRVFNPDTNITQQWAIARSDHLPRRLVTGIPQMGDTTIVLSKVRTNPPVTIADLEIEPPANFEVVDRGPNRVAAAAPGQANKPVRQIGGEVGNEAPDFELANAGGEMVRLKNLRPNIVVLSFWGSWCLPCREANDELQSLAEHFDGQPVKVVTLACKEKDPADAIAAMEENGYTFELLVDADKTARLYKILRYPTILVVGREGEILYAARGYKADEDPFTEIRTVIEDALSAPANEDANQAGEAGAPPNRGGDSGGERTTSGGSTGGGG